MSETKEETKHTPGPWEVVHHGNGTGSREWAVCPKGSLQGIAIWLTEADARLMAAAPDLLEALQGVLRVADRKTVEFDAARAAIAKALATPTE